MDAEHPPILVVSDGTGASAELLVRSMLVQFGDPHVPLIKLPGATRRQEIDTAVELAREHQALMVVYTILAPDLRSRLHRGCREARIPAVDLVGGLLEVLTEHLDAPNQFRPGLFRRLHQEYFQRVEAIDFAIAHDDGQKLETLDRADMVLLGVSRTGKTPLSMYLAMQGWKAANVPLIPGIEPPRQLTACDPRRLVGLTISNDLLVQHRTHRQSSLGRLPDGYADPGRVFAETEHALGIFRQRRIPAVDVTNKPIEASAREVVERITRRLGHENLPGQGL